MLPKSVSFILLVTKGILRDRMMRRRVLSWLVFAVLAVMGIGIFLLDDWLMAHPVLFLLYWGGCLWLTLTFGLLALYDLLVVRAEAARERRRLSHEVFGREEERKKEPPSGQP
ncbi:MAG: hypothetical protein PHQ12_05980 [Chthoniobacteraceae bacterium]|nr:hypothetical protein [Chthoniobacteraceae bacterium]